MNVVAVKVFEFQRTRNRKGQSKWITEEDTLVAGNSLIIVGVELPLVNFNDFVQRR